MLYQPRHRKGCKEDQAKSFAEERSRTDTANASFALASMFGSFNGIVYSIMTQTFVAGVSSGITPNKIFQYSILIAFVTMAFFLVMRAIVESEFCLRAWRSGHDFCRLMMKNAQAARYIVVFLLMNAITLSFQRAWSLSLPSAIETVILVWCILLVFNFIQIVAAK